MIVSDHAGHFKHSGIPVSSDERLDKPDVCERLVLLPQNPQEAHFKPPSTMTQDLISSISFQALMADYDAVCCRIEQAHALLEEAQEIAQAKGLGQILANRYRTFIRMEKFLEPDGASKAKAYTDQHAWQLLFSRTHVLDIMTAKGKEEWRTAIDKGEAPPFTKEAVSGTLRDLYEHRQAVFGMSVVECFQSLQTRYLRNKLSKFNRRVLISNFFKGMGTLPDPGTGDEVDDLLRFMAICDGKPIPHGESVRNAVQRVSLHGGERLFENEYLALRWFKNGNAHLTFKRLDLLDALNAEIAAHLASALPAPRNSRFSSNAARAQWQPA